MARIGLSACECEMPRMPSVPDASTGLAEEEIADAPLGVKCRFCGLDECRAPRGFERRCARLHGSEQEGMKRSIGYVTI